MGSDGREGFRGRWSGSGVALLALLAAACGNDNVPRASERGIDSPGLATPTPGNIPSAAPAPGAELTPTGELTEDGQPVAVDESGGRLVLNELVGRYSESLPTHELVTRAYALGFEVLDVGSLLDRELHRVRVRFDADLPQSEAADLLEGAGLFETLERHYLAELLAVPADPRYGDLWGLAKIGGPTAWDETTGSTAVDVVVLDTGVDLTHPDLAANISTNSAEIPNNGVDDDNNGYVDDIVGWDFVSEDAAPTDGHGHGTHVAGTIGAVGNNGLGVVGVNWRVSIIAGRVCGSSSCSMVDVTEGILYAAKRGARVVNMSLGGYRPPLDYERQAIERVGQAGGIILAAAGNDARNNDVYQNYPSNYDYPFLVAVAATTITDGLASFSNYGVTRVHLGAPGQNILSTVPGGGYASMSGTSMATPHVAGAAALLLAKHPTLTGSQVKDQLLATGLPTAALAGKTSTSKRLDLGALLAAAPPCEAGNPGCARECSSTATGTECVDFVSCADQPCAEEAVCTDTERGYLCECAAGFTGSGLSCEDENECVANPNACDRNGTCDNRHGTYLCHCPDAFVSGVGNECRDRNECEDGSALCPPNAECENLPGTYRCHGGDSSFPPPDVDECALRLDSCDPDATCLNTDGSYVCICNPGYNGNGFFCRDTDECTDGLNPCGENAVCENAEGGFECSCAEGYVGDGYACADENECEEGSDLCDPNASCTNVVGSYACACLPGFVGNGLTCTDVNECDQQLDDCDADAECTNTPGGFTCTCDVGFSGDGRSCLPIGGGGGGSPGAGGSSGSGGQTGGGTPGSGEQTGSGGSGAGAGGSGTGGAGESGGGGGAPGSGGQSSGGASGAGGQTATGGAGSGAGGQSGTGGQSGSGGAAGSGGATGSGGESGSGGGAPGTGGQVGSGGSTGSGGAAGGGGGIPPASCASANPCSPNANCEDTVSGPTCSCRAGYDGDGMTCVDRDECVAAVDDCDDDAICTNTEGAFYCSCPPGYYGNGRTCLLNPGYVRALTSKGDHTCALLEGGSVRCWGFNFYGQLGYGDAENTGDDETAGLRGYLPLGDEAVQVEAGVAHTCALLENGKVLCWGKNTYGQLGLGHTENIGDDETVTEAGVVDVGGTVTALALGGEHTCALLAGGSVKCWGLAIHGQLGYGNQNNVGDDESPSSLGTVPLAAPAVALTAGRDHTCALLDSGIVTCFGRGLWAPTGLGHKNDIGDDEVPTTLGQVELGAPAVAISAGWYHTCAIVDIAGTHRLRCFGYGGEGQLGYGHPDTIGDDETPASAGDVPLGFSPHLLATGLYHTCAIDDANQVRCFGYGKNGRLGYANEDDLGDDEPLTTLATVPLGAPATSVAAGAEHTCAALASGMVRCFGDATYGQLGRGDQETIGDDEYPDGSEPILLGDVDECLLGTHTCDAVAFCTDASPGYTCECPRGYVGDGYSCALRENVILAMDVGDDHTCVLVTTGTSYAAGNDLGSLRCFGYAAYGQLGYGNTANIGDTEHPNAVGAVDVGEPVESLSLGGNHTCVVTASGKLRCFGDGSRGQLGLASTQSLGGAVAPSTAPPVDIGGVVRAVAAGRHHTCALLEGGGVRCFGEGALGRLGYGNTSRIGDTEHPRVAGNVALGGVATKLASGDFHTCALIAPSEGDPGGLRCFGANMHGQLGLGHTRAIGDDEHPSSVPYVDAGGKVVDVAAGGSHTCVLLEGGSVRCFGLGTYGALGYGNTTTIGDNESVVSGGLLTFPWPVVELSAGANHTCAILDGTAPIAERVRCWGNGSAGALGLGSTAAVGTTTPATAAAALGFGVPAHLVRAGANHTCAALGDELACWGAASFGQTGHASTATVGSTNLASTHGWVELF